MFCQLLGVRRAPGRAAWRLSRQILRVLAMGCLLQVGAAEASPDPESALPVGRGLFLGESPLWGVIAGHAEALPPQAVACANCHMGETGPGSGARFGPALNHAAMTELRNRRGGPPSSFSLASFCQLLRNGVDPAYIIITRRMPRYTLSDDQCRGLWRYIMEASDESGGK